MAESTRRKAAATGLALAEQRARQAEADLEAALIRFEGTSNEPDEPKKNSIIKFRVQFQNGGTTYTYVAYRAPNGEWYRTGSVDVFTWSTLLDFMYRDVTAKRLGIGFHLMSARGSKWIGREQV